MTFVATLISNPAAPSLDAAAIERARRALPSAETPIWLELGIAADIPFIGGRENTQAADTRALSEHVRAALAGAPIDVLLQPASGRRKRLFLADMDSTMIGQECIDELADYVGVKPQDRKSTRLNSSHSQISYAVFCLKKKNETNITIMASQTLFPIASSAGVLTRPPYMWTIVRF